MPAREVPKAEDVRQLLLDFHGDEHYGLSTTEQMILKRYYWRRMTQMVKKNLESCKVCQERRFRKPTQFQLHRIVPTALIFVMIGLDTLRLPSLHKYEELINIVHYTSRYEGTWSVREAVTGMHVVRAVHE